MAQFTIGAAGVGLQPPQALYPASILNQPQVSATNAISLAPGCDILLAPGTWLVSPGLYSQIQILDPVTTTWRPYNTSTAQAPFMVQSDGVNYRIINPTGFAIGAVVTASGNGYTSAPTVTPTPAGSLWTAVIGGGVSAIQATPGGSGSGYAAAPIVNIAAPPSPGVPATATATINSGGSITVFSITNQGAGYTSPPAVTIIPQAGDQNAFPPSGTSSTNVVNATAAALTSFNGMLTAVLMTNEGNTVAGAPPALAFSGGGGSSGAATVFDALSITNILVATGGSGFGAGVGITTIGGSILGLTSYAQSAAAINPTMQLNLLIPRQAQITATLGSGSGVQVGLIQDGGLFTAAPTAYAVPTSVTAGGSSVPAAATFTLTMGGNTDTVYIQPL